MSLLERLERLAPRKLALLVLDLQSRLETLERRHAEAVAIVGMACRFPAGADTPERYWQLLREGRHAISEIPSDRWAVDAYYDPAPEAPGKMYVRHGGFLSNVDRFDPGLFGISPREATSMDPQHRLLLEVTWEALERAGQNPAGLAGTKTGVFVGITASDYAQIVASAGARYADAYLMTGNALSFAAGRVSYVLGLQGPCMAVDTACSASLTAVHLACRSLRVGDCTTALAAGVNLMLHPAGMVMTSKARMLSAAGLCRPFDASADGIVRAEGCGVVVLKPLSAALAARDPILAIIRGSAINQDGQSSGITVPNGRAQEALITEALRDAGVQPREISYVEAHGTGTRLGDPIEVRALQAALGAGRSSSEPLLLGSVKSNIGHAESAAGIAGLMKTVLALQHREIPPHLHLERLNPDISPDHARIVIPTTPTPWTAGRRLAGVSSFGASGTNVHVILEEAPESEPGPSDVLDRPVHVLTLSAREEKALAELSNRYAVHLDGSSPALADLCFTANTGRAHLEHRLAIVADSADAMRAALRNALDVDQSCAARGHVSPGDRPKVAFLFTGQGAQYVGMARALYDRHVGFRQVLERCHELLKTELEQPLISVLYPAEGKASPLDETAYTQPALFAIEYALCEVWRAWGVEPAAVLGHSIGEYAAACVAGVLKLDDALKLVAARGRLMQALPRGGAMAAVFAGEARVRPALAGYEDLVAVAAINGPENTVISGEAAAVSSVLDALARTGIRAQRLAASHAFHSPLMEPMLDNLERVAASTAPAPPRMPIVSNVTGALVDPAFAFDAAYWRRHAREAVRFADGVSALYAQGYRLFLEVGPAPTLLALARRTVQADDAVWLPSVRKDRDEWAQMLSTLAELYVRGVSVDWSGFDASYPRRRILLPTYPFQRERYWVDAPESRGAGHVAEATKTRAQLSDCLHEIRWIDRARAATALAGSEVRDGRWLLLADRGGVARLVRKEIRRLGGEGLLVTDGYTDDAGDVDWCRDSDNAAYLRLIARAGSDSSRLAGVLHFSSLDVDRHDDVTRLVTELARLVQALHRLAREGSSPRLWVVTRGAQPADAAAPPVAVAQAPVWGFGRVVAMEHPELWGGLIDLDQRRPEDGADQIASEVLAPDGEDQIAFRDGRRLVARLVATKSAASVTPIVCSADAAYLITGGLGALGLHVARRLVERGARHLVLVGRKGLPPRESWPDLVPESTQGRQAAAVAALEGAGASVRVVTADVADPGDVARLVADLRADGCALRGVIHAAGVVRDAAVSEISAQAIEETLRPKVAGAWLLHESTRDLPLDFFVLFSSISSVWGSKGLGAYAAANHFLDAVAHYRRTIGLPALAINWGPWAHGGMLTAQGQEWFRQMGVAAFTPIEALDALDELLGSGFAQAIVVRVDWQRFIPVYTARARRPFFERFDEAAGSVVDRVPRTASADLRAMSPADRERTVEALVRDAVADVLSFPRAAVDVDRSLSQLGLDSLMAVELRNRLQRETGVLVPVVAFLDGSSARGLAGLVLDNFDRGAEAPPSVSATITPAEAEALLGRLSELTEQEVENLLARLAASGSPA